MGKLWDVLLYPVRFYGRLTDKKAALFAGIIFVGIIDLFSPDYIKTYINLFTGKPLMNVQYNVLLAVALIFLIGFADVIFFSAPLFDIFKFFKKKEGLPEGLSVFKIMKVYIMSHFLIIPVTTFLYYAVFQYINEKSSVLMLNLYVAQFFIILIWSSAIVSRGINALFAFNPIFRRLIFIMVFTWNFILGMVFDLQIINMLMKLFK